MKRVLSFVGLLLAFCFLPVAFAQASSGPIPLPGFDLKAWGGNAALFAAFVVAVVGLIRQHIPPRPDGKARVTGYAALGLSFVVSELGAFLLYTAGWLTDPTYTSYKPPLVWVLFGLSAFVIASGGYAALVQVLTARGSVVAIPVTVNPGPQRQVPVGTPGSEVLHQLDGTVSAVVPLTPGQPTQVTGLEELKK